jgi:transmembrane sensor
MKQTIPPPQGSAAEQAEYWLALLDSPLIDQQQRLAFQQWLETSPKNRLAWEKTQAWWQKIDLLSETQIATLEHRLSANTTKAVPVKSNLKKSPQRLFNPWSFPAFACLLLVAWFGFAFGPRYFADFHTGVGEIRTIQLSDGSTVMLNTDSTLSVDYSSQQRNITLQGEAYFKVSPDSRRPFEVHTENGLIRALGTAFDVKQVGADMAVTVYEHSVRVAFRHGETIEHLQEGQRVVLSNRQISPIETVNLNQAKAWQEHELIFKNQTLQQVVAELNRYRSGKIIITDSTLAEHRVTGIFDSADPEAALNAIEKTLDVKEYRPIISLVLLARRSS